MHSVMLPCAYYAHTTCALQALFCTNLFRLYLWAYNAHITRMARKKSSNLTLNDGIKEKAAKLMEVLSEDSLTGLVEQLIRDKHAEVFGCGVIPPQEKHLIRHGSDQLNEPTAPSNSSARPASPADNDDTKAQDALAAVGMAAEKHHGAKPKRGSVVFSKLRRADREAKKK